MEMISIKFSRSPLVGLDNPFTNLLIIEDFIDFINANTSIELTAAELNTLGDLMNFDLLVWPLINRLSQMSEVDLDSYIDFITNYPDFIQTPNESVYFLDHSDFTIALDNWLSNHNDDLGISLGQFIFDTYFENNLSEAIRESFMEITEVYNVTDNLSFDESIPNDFSSEPGLINGEVKTTFKKFIEFIPPARLEIVITGIPGIKPTNSVIIDPYVLSETDPVSSGVLGITAGLAVEQTTHGAGRATYFPDYDITHFDIPINYNVTVGLDISGIQID